MRSLPTILKNYEFGIHFCKKNILINFFKNLRLYPLSPPPPLQCNLLRHLQRCLVYYFIDNVFFLFSVTRNSTHVCICVAIVQCYVFIRILYLGIVYCTRSRSQTVVQGRLATSCCQRERLPPDGWRPLAVAGGSQSGVYS